MKLAQLAITVSMTGLLFAGNAFAQNGNQNVQNTSSRFDSYYASSDDTPSPSDRAVQKGCDSGSSCDSKGGCDSGCSRFGGIFECCGHGEPWTLQGELQSCDDGCSRLNYGGWLSAGVTVNSQGNDTTVGNFPVAWRNDPHFNADQAWMFAERVTDTGGCGWDWGFRADIMYGVDGPDTQAFGGDDWDTTWGGNANAPGRQYGGALPQLYADIAYNDLTVRMGHFFTIIGYETIPAPQNFFYSHSYMQYYAEPFTHTGAYADYKVDDQWNVIAGYTMGWDTGFDNSNDADTFLGGITWSSLDERTSVAYTTSIGNFGNGTAGIGNAGDIYLHSFVVSHQIDDCWNFVFHHDYGQNSGAGVVNSDWYGAAAYLVRRIDDCWSVGGRLEWFDDEDGARVAGTPGSFYDFTVGVNWAPNANFRLRPEVRYDWFSGTGSPFDPRGGVGSATDLFTFGVDGVFTF